MKVILILPPLHATKIFFRFQATKKCIVGNVLSLQQLFITLCPKRELISFQGQILGCRHPLTSFECAPLLVFFLCFINYFIKYFFKLFLSYLSLTMGISFGVIEEMSPWCLIYKCCKIKQPDSFWSSYALFCIRGTEETCIGWKSLLRRRMEHQAIFMYKLRNSHFYCLIPVSSNCDFDD